MSKAQLEGALGSLHRELEETDQLDPEQVAQLEIAIGEIRQVLDERTPPPTSLQERLAASARRLEDSHPTLTNTLGRVMDALAQIGI